MAQQTVDLGAGPYPANAASTDTPYSAFGKINANFTEVYGRISTVPFATKTGAYTFVLADAGTVIELNAATAANFTVPPNASVAFPVGTVIEVFTYGVGLPSIVAGSGVTVRTGNTLVSRGQYTSMVLRKRATDEWILFGAADA